MVAVILLPILTAAQAAPDLHPGFSAQTGEAILGPPGTGSTARSRYQAYTRYTAIRRGREENVGILLKSGGFVTAASSAVPGMLPLKLELEPLDGFTINEVQVPKGSKSNFKFQGEVVKVSAAPYLQFKIRAQQNTPSAPAS